MGKNSGNFIWCSKKQTYFACMQHFLAYLIFQSFSPLGENGGSVICKCGSS